MTIQYDVAWRNQNDLNAKALGIDEQINQTMEECAELIQALNKYRRYVIKGNLMLEQQGGYKQAVIEELADVMIMWLQIITLLDINFKEVMKTMEYKINRTADRIAKSGGNYQ